MRIAINGFGHIGRNVLKIALEHSDIEIVAINDVTDPVILAHLLKHDSTYGVYKRQVSIEDKILSVDDKKITLLAQSQPAELPWKEMEIDVVIESTGVFCTAQAEKGGYRDHITAGASKVILTAPAKDKIDQTIVLGVNDAAVNEQSVAYSSTSSTVNCLAPVLKVLNDSFGLIDGFMTTVQAYTNDQVLLDLPHQDIRGSRAAAFNIIPTSIDAASTIGQVLPELDTRIHGMAMSVPVSTGSALDLVARLAKTVSLSEVNKAFREAADQHLKGILEYSEAALVSSDIKGNSHSAIFDSSSTIIGSGGLVKLLAWYDNEFGYCTRVVDLAQKMVQ